MLLTEPPLPSDKSCNGLLEDTASLGANIFWGGGGGSKESFAIEISRTGTVRETSGTEDLKAESSKKYALRREGDLKESAEGKDYVGRGYAVSEVMTHARRPELRKRKRRERRPHGSSNIEHAKKAGYG